MNEEEFYRGTKWRWMPEDSDIWFYKTGQVVQSIGGELTGFSATVNEVTESSFTITYSGEDSQTYGFFDIFSCE